MAGLGKIIVPDGADITLYSSNNAASGSVKMDSNTSMLLDGKGAVAIASANNLEFRANASITGTGATSVSLGKSGDTINLNIAGVTYNLPNLTRLSDVSVSSPASDHILMYDGANWVNTDSPNAKVWLASGYKTAIAGGANYWAKIGQVRLTATGQYGYATVRLASGEHTGANALRANLFLRVKQEAAMASAPRVEFFLMENQNCTTADFYAKTAVNTATETIVELYVKLLTSGDAFAFTPTMQQGTGVWAWTNGGATSATVPTGGINPTADSVDAGQLTTVQVNKGGTGRTTVASGLIMYGAANGTDALLSDTNFTYASSTLSAPYVKATGATKTAGAFYGGTTDPSSTNRTNYDGYLYTTRLYEGSNQVGFTLKANTDAGQFINSGGTVDIKSGTNVSLSRTGSAITINSTDTNTATAVNNIFEGSNSGTAITYKPFTTQQASTLSFDTSSTNPTHAGRLNLNGKLYATELYDNGNRVLTSLTGSVTGVTDGLFDLAVTTGNLSVVPYASQQAATLSFDTSNTNPVLGTRLNINANLYATKLYSGANEVFTLAGGSLSSNANLTLLGTGNLTLANAPTADMHAATKKYVDDLASGLDVRASVKYATTAAITATYANGTNGVGATLTMTGVVAAADAKFDLPAATSLVVNDRVLVKNQSVAAQNGIYYVSSMTTNTVLTRAIGSDDANQLNPGIFTFVEKGTVNGDTGWVMTADGPITVGTTDITWTQFSGSATFGADGTSIIKTGNVFSHADTSNQNSVDNSNGNVIQDVTLDTYGHVTGLASIDLDLRYSKNTFTGVKAVASDGTTSRGQADADTLTDVLTLKEGTGITMAVDTTNDVITISASTDSATVGGVSKSGLLSSTVERQTQTSWTASTGNNTIVTIPNAKTYVMGTGRLMVFRDGFLQIPVTDYVETNNTSVTFTYDLPTGSEVHFVILSAAG